MCSASTAWAASGARWERACSPPRPVNSAGKNGLFYGGGAELLGKQIVGVLVAVAIAVIGTLIIGLIVKAVTGLRASADAEDNGLDVALHGEEAYSGGAGGAGTLDGVPAFASSGAHGTPVAASGTLKPEAAR
jgi:Amt family ammonium transporter